MIRAEDVGLVVSKARGHEVLVTCPFHDDHHPSAWFNTMTGLFYCFACGASKNAAQVAVELGFDAPDDGVLSGSYAPVVEIEAEEYEWSRFIGGSSAIDNDYLLSRGVQNNIIEHYGIRTYSSSIVFPIYDTNEKITGVIVRQTHRLPKYLILGKRQPVWPIRNIMEMGNDGNLFLTEGVFGVLRADSELSLNSAAILGTQGVSKFLKFYEYNKGLLAGRVVAIMDCDLPGQVAAAKLALAGIRVAVGHTKPPDDWSKKTWIKLVNKTDKVTTVNINDIAETVKKDNRSEFYKLIRRNYE